MIARLEHMEAPGAELGARRGAHRSIALGITGLVLALAVALPEPSLPIQLGLVTIVVGALGLPHGALDALVGLRRAPGRLRLGLAGFVAVYLALAALPVLAWFRFPVATLLTFLAASWIHFGRGDSFRRLESGFERTVEVFVRGGVPILLPTVFRPTEAGPVFAALVDVPSEPLSALLVRFAPAALLVWLALATLTLRSLSRSQSDSPAALLELPVLTALFWLLPPLTAFGLYFGLWHSMRHLIALDLLLGRGEGLTRQRLIRAGLPMLLGSTALFGLGYLFFAGVTVDHTALIRTLFIGLAALTLPHTIVTAWVDRALQFDPAFERSTPAGGVSARPPHPLGGHRREALPAASHPVSGP